MVCYSCMNFLGDAEFQMDILSGTTSRQIISQQGGKHGSSVIAVPCKNECGELYCSSVCAETHWNNGHKHLCTGKISEEEANDHPLILFKTHACSTNEIFLLVADVFSRICCEVENAEAKGIDTTIAANKAKSPFARFVRGLWWDVAVSPRRFEHESLKSVLCNLVQESHELLSSALNLKARGLDKHLDSDYFSQTIGMFEQNNVGIRLENPIHKYVEEVLSTKDISNVNIEKLLQKVSIIVEKIDKLNDVSEQEEDYNDEKEDENDGLEYGDDQDQSVAIDGSGPQYLPFLNVFVNDLKRKADDANKDTASESDDSDDDLASDDQEYIEGDANLIEVYDETGKFDVDAARRKITTLINQTGKETIFPPLDGTAFYTLICKANHSCHPNACVKYSIHRDHGLVAEMQLIRSISVGEELTISYIDESKSYKKRSKLLQNYGFNCTCIKCR